MNAVKSIEANLIRLAMKGDQRAFAEMVGMYQDKLYHLAYRMLYNRQEAEDAVQETFLRVFRNMERYDESMKFSTWIYRITTNLAIDRLRRRKPGFSLDAELPEHDGLDGYSMFASEDASPEDEVLLSETQQIIRAAIDTLPPKYKTIMVLGIWRSCRCKRSGMCWTCR